MPLNKKIQIWKFLNKWEQVPHSGCSTEMWMVDLLWQVKLRGLFPQEETAEEILKDLYYGAAKENSRSSLSLGRSCKK